MDWAPRYSVGLYHHLGMVDGPSMDQIDEAFRAVDQIPDLAGVEFFSGTCVTLDNAHQVKERLDDRGLKCSHDPPRRALHSRLVPVGRVHVTRRGRAARGHRHVPTRR